MATSGWCSQHGRPACDRCLSERCSHGCHGADLAQHKPDGRGETGAAWENDRAADTANEAARPRRKTGPDLPITQLRT